MKRPKLAPTRGYAVIATSVALTLINVGLAVLIVSAVGLVSVAPVWVGGALVAAGVVAAAGAFALWRSYLQAAHGH